MQLTHCHEQKSQTLDEFYLDISSHDHEVNRQVGKAMLALIARLRALSDNRQVFGLTSHYHLCLLAQDTSWSPWFVRIAALNNRNYDIEYLMPRAEAPWPAAYVRGRAQSEDDAVKMILTAMEKSKGWGSEASQRTSIDFGSWKITHDPLGLAHAPACTPELEADARVQGEDIFQIERAESGIIKQLDLGWYRDRFVVLLVRDGAWGEPDPRVEAPTLSAALEVFHSLARRV